MSDFTMTFSHQNTDLGLEMNATISITNNSPNPLRNGLIRLLATETHGEGTAMLPISLSPGQKTKVSFSLTPFAVHDILELPTSFTAELMSDGRKICTKQFNPYLGTSNFHKRFLQGTPVKLLAVGPPGAGKTAAMNSFKTVRQATHCILLKFTSSRIRHFCNLLTELFQVVSEDSKVCSVYTSDGSAKHCSVSVQKCKRKSLFFQFLSACAMLAF